MAHRHTVQKRNVGGGVQKVYGNSNVTSAAASKSEGFKRGGKVHGEKAKMHRLDKRARGGGTKSPFSSAKTSEKGNLTYSGGTKTRP